MGVQEVKAQATDVAGRFERVAGMTGHFHFAQKKGYAGVGLYTPQAPSDVVAASAPRVRRRGPLRRGALRHAPQRASFSVISCYFPSGSSGESGRRPSSASSALIYPHLLQLKAEREFILVGDINIAHKEIDLKNWRGNRRTAASCPRSAPG